MDINHISGFFFFILCKNNAYNLSLKIVKKVSIALGRTVKQKRIAEVIATVVGGGGRSLAVSESCILSAISTQSCFPY